LLLGLPDRVPQPCVRGIVAGAAASLPMPGGFLIDLAIDPAA
jgi:hypothetical protein